MLDPMELLLKEDIKPAATDDVVFRLAPVVFFAPVIAAFVVLPLSPYLTAGALGAGIIYYVALSSIDVIGVFMAGWGSNSKYALIGGLRAAVQMISYELTLVLALVGVVLLSSALAPVCAVAHLDLSTCGVGSISFTESVAAQMRPQTPWLWFILLQPLGLFVYYICGLAETNRSPFDLPEAESELVAGYLTDYSGLRWAIFSLGEYGNMSIVAAAATALFLGGWSMPGTAIGVWTDHLGTFGGQLVVNVLAAAAFIIKMYVLLLVFIWIRATLPRLRADQLMRFAWLYLIPLTLLNLLLTAGPLLPPLGPTWRLVLTAAVNWALLALIVTTLGKLVGVSPTGRLPRWFRSRGSGLSRPSRSAVQPTVSSTATPLAAMLTNRTEYTE